MNEYVGRLRGEGGDMDRVVLRSVVWPICTIALVLLVKVASLKLSWRYLCDEVGEVTSIFYVNELESGAVGTITYHSPWSALGHLR